MLRSKLPLDAYALRLSHLLVSSRSGVGSSGLDAFSAAAASAFCRGHPSADGVNLTQRRRGYAAGPKAERDESLSGEVRQAARELGLDAVPYSKLKGVWQQQQQ